MVPDICISPVHIKQLLDFRNNRLTDKAPLGIDMSEEGRKALTQLHTLVLELIEEASRAKHRGNKDAQEARHEGKNMLHFSL